MSLFFQGAAETAQALGLERRQETLTWGGRVDGVKVRIELLPHAQSAEDGGSARIVVTLARALRLGCLACTGPNLAPLGAARAIPFDHPRLDTFLVLGAVEPEVARDILCACAGDIVALRGTNLRISDRTIELSEGILYTARAFVEQVPQLVTLAQRLVRERDEWEAPYETRIAPVWSDLATEAGMTWDADRFRITGELFGARIDARITSDVGTLSARVRSRWPSLGQGLGRSWRARSPAEAPEEWPTNAWLSTEADHATRLVRSSGASLSLDDEGAIAELPGVEDSEQDHRAPMLECFRGMLTLTRALLEPKTTTGGIYR